MSETPNSKLEVTRTGAVTRITFNSPGRRNAIDGEMSARLLEAVEQARNDDSKVVVLAGAGDAFCAGADLKALPAGNDPSNITDYLRRVVKPIILGLRQMPKPVLAAVHGVAVGIGCNFALAADIRIATPEAKFGQVFSKIGLIPDGGSTYLLPKLIGYAKAFELMVTGELVGGEQALAMGLVNRLVPVAELAATVDTLAARLAAGPSLAFAGIKQGLNIAESGTLEDALEFEAVYQKTCAGSKDFREGVSAFLEKRNAAFTGE